MTIGADRFAPVAPLSASDSLLYGSSARFASGGTQHLRLDMVGGGGSAAGSGSATPSMMTMGSNGGSSNGSGGPRVPMFPPQGVHSLASLQLAEDARTAHTAPQQPFAQARDTFIVVGDLLSRAGGPGFGSQQGLSLPSPLIVGTVPSQPLQMPTLSDGELRYLMRRFVSYDKAAPSAGAFGTVAAPASAITPQQQLQNMQYQHQQQQLHQLQQHQQKQLQQQQQHQMQQLQQQHQQQQQQFAAAVNASSNAMQL